LVWIPKKERTSVDLLEKVGITKIHWKIGPQKSLSLSKALAAKNVWRLIQGTCLFV